MMKQYLKATIFWACICLWKPFSRKCVRRPQVGVDSTERRYRWSRDASVAGNKVDAKSSRIPSARTSIYKPLHNEKWN